MRRNYRALDRWLHWLALEPAVVRHLAFDLECGFALRGQPDPPRGSDRPVYVCGLARSGTTILLRVLDAIDEFRSLKYRDMPFVLAPNLWRSITRHVPRDMSPTERVHGDGILVDFDSPESFEEVFWRTFGSHEPGLRCTGAAAPDEGALLTFARFRALVAEPLGVEPLPGGKPRRYLSKNNNNLVRLRPLAADPTASVLLVYRNPVATARSLHRLHLRFSAQQLEDDFMRHYMRWLGHHEFGLDHLPFCFAADALPAGLEPTDPNYWLAYWTAVYDHVVSQPDLPVTLIDHDVLCARPQATLRALFDMLGVQADAVLLSKVIHPAPQTAASTEGLEPELLAAAEATHRQLTQSRRNVG